MQGVVLALGFLGEFEVVGHVGFRDDELHGSTDEQKPAFGKAFEQPEFLAGNHRVNSVANLPADPFQGIKNADRGQSFFTLRENAGKDDFGLEGSRDGARGNGRGNRALGDRFSELSLGEMTHGLHRKVSTAEEDDGEGRQTAA